MHYKTRSYLIIFTAIVIAVCAGLILGSYDQGTTGAVIGREGVACSVDSECNDRISCTLDSCKNPGTDRSFCVHSRIEYCHSDDGCCPKECAGLDTDCSS